VRKFFLCIITSICYTVGACSAEQVSASSVGTQRQVDEVRLPATNDPLLLELRNIQLPPGADGARIFLSDSSKSFASAKEYVGRVSVGHQNYNSHSAPTISSVQEVPESFAIAKGTKPAELSVLIEPLKQGVPVKGSVKVDNVVIRPSNM
jgi:hypothetical protein